MANDTVPMPAVFSACVAEMEDCLLPLHYQQLTERALARLGIPKQAVNWHRQIEDVREKLVEAERFGTAYTGEPQCLVFLRSWVRSDEPMLFNNIEKPVIIINANFPCSEEACIEALMREPYMLTKTSAPRERRLRGLAKGMLIEHHIKEYFRSRWPDFYVAADNERKWEMACDHDFKLLVGGKLCKVDIAGEHLNGRFGRSPGKRGVDIHIMAKLYGDRLVLEGFSPGSQFIAREHLDWWNATPIQPLLVYLNCQKAGIDYASLRV